MQRVAESAGGGLRVGGFCQSNTRGDRTLRVALYGNICNNLYQLGLALRSTGTCDAHLFLERTGDAQTHPQSDDPSLAERLPDWMHYGDWMYGPRAARHLLAPFTSPIIAQLRTFDLLIASGEGVSLAPFVDCPTWFVTTGGDLTINPFPLRALKLYAQKPLISKVAAFVRAFWTRRGIEAVDLVWSQPFQPFRAAIARLGIPLARQSGTAFKIPFATAGFTRLSRREAVERVPELSTLQPEDFVVFHPSRLMIRDDEVLRATGQWKANDVLLRGFARFREMARHTRPVLVLIDRPASHDVAIAKRIIAELDCAESVIWLKPEDPSGFPREDLRAMYSVADAVADDFGAGWFGSVVVEACATRTPVVTYVDEEAMASMYPDHPFLSARTEEEVAVALGRLAADREFARSTGAEGAAWVDRHHSSAAVSRSSAELFRRALGPRS